MAESSEQQSYSTEQLDTIIENEIQKFLNSLSKSDFSIGWIGWEVTITPIKKLINEFLISKDIGETIKKFAELNLIGRYIVKPELIDRVNAFKKEIISMRISNTIPTEERLNKLRETIGTTKTISEDSKKLQQDVKNNQQNTPKTNTNPPQQKQTPPQQKQTPPQQKQTPPQQKQTPPKATPKSPSSNPRPPQRQEQRQQREGVQEGNEYISKAHVERVWQDILNGATYRSDEKGTCTRDTCKYKGVCTTWAYNVLSRLINLPPPRNTDYNGYEEKLKAMHCYFYRNDINPKNPYAWWYKPKDWDMAVRPHFESKHGRTQHMACYIHGERVSDTIQRRMGPDRKPTNIPTMSCYLSDPNEPQEVQIYRYDPKRNS